MDPAASVPNIDIPSLAGPYLLGHLLSFSLFGVLCIQLYVYNIAFKKDPLWLKALVYKIAAIEVTFQGIETYMAWWSLGGGWGKVPQLLGFPNATTSFTTLTGIVTSLVHGFYCWRIIVLSKRHFVVIAIAVFSLIQLCMTIYITVFLVRHQSSPTVDSINESFKVITIWFVFAAAADILITIVMSSILLKARRKTLYKPTLNRLQVLVKYTAETGFVTSCAVITDLILFRAIPNTNYHFLAFYSIGKIYANTLLATLNSRIAFITSTSQLSTSNRALRLQHQNYLWDDPQSRSLQAPDNSVRVTTTTLILKDSEDVELAKKGNENIVQETESDFASGSLAGCSARASRDLARAG